jgi:TPR repeat protein
MTRALRFLRISSIVLAISLLIATVPVAAQRRPPAPATPSYGQLMAIGYECFTQGKIKEAYTAALMGAVINPRGFESYMLAAAIMQVRGEYTHAKNFVDKALERADASQKSKVRELAAVIEKSLAVSGRRPAAEASSVARSAAVAGLPTPADQPKQALDAERTAVSPPAGAVGNMSAPRPTVDVDALRNAEAAYLSNRFDAAFPVYKAGAEAGNPGAMTYLAIMYATGQGVTRDDAVARQWFESAAAAGIAVAMRNLGVMHRDGLGGPPDLQQAHQWFEKAAAGGYTNAMTDLGVLYYNGQGVSRDFNIARQCFEKAAAGGDEDAMTNIAVLFENGLGVTRDLRSARQWYEKAAAAGSHRAKEWLQKNLR